MAKKNLFIEVLINTRKANRSVGKLKGSLNLLGSTLRAVFRTAIFVGFFLAMRAGVMAVRNLVESIKTLGKESANFQFITQQTATVMTKGGLQTSQMYKDLAKHARQLSTQTQYTAQQIQKGMFTAAIAGYDFKEAINLSTTAMKLAQLAGVEFQGVTNGLIGITKAFNVEIEQVASTADIMTASFTSAKMTLMDFFTAMKYVAPIAVTAFGDSAKTFVDTAAALMTLTNIGLDSCYDKKTEVLTKQGWKKWTEVSNKNEYATVNSVTNKIEYQKPTKFIKYKYTGSMYEFKNKFVNLFVTPNHRMFVRFKGKKDFSIVKAENLYKKNREWLVGGLNWKGRNKEYISLKAYSFINAAKEFFKPTIKIKTEDFVEFLGFFISEGHVNKSKKGYYVYITQKKYKKEVESCLDKLPFKYDKYKIADETYQYRICNKQLFEYCFNLGKSLNRYIPKEILSLSKENLLILFNSLMLGDGSGRQYFTSSKQLCNDFQELCLKLGFGVSYSEAEPKDNCYIKGKKIISLNKRYIINVNRKFLTPETEHSGFKKGTKHHSRKKKPNKFYAENIKQYDDFVYCAEVPNGLLIVRRGGKISVCGNSKSGVYLRGTMLKLMGSTNKIATTFAKYGINIYETNSKSRKFMKTMIRGQKVLDSYYKKVAELKDKQYQLILSNRQGTTEYAAIADQVMKTESTISELSKGTATLYKQFTMAGGKLKPFSQVLKSIQKSMPSEVLTKIFGVRGGAGIGALLENEEDYKKNIKTLQKWQKESEKGVSILHTMYSKLLDTVMVKWAQIKNTVWNSFNVVFGALFDKASPLLDTVLKGVQKIWTEIESNPEVFEKIFKNVIDTILPEIKKFFEELPEIIAKIGDVFDKTKKFTVKTYKAVTGEEGGTSIVTKESEIKGGVGEKLKALLKSGISFLYASILKFINDNQKAFTTMGDFIGLGLEMALLKAKVIFFDIGKWIAIGLVREIKTILPEWLGGAVRVPTTEEYIKKEKGRLISAEAMDVMPGLGFNPLDIIKAESSRSKRLEKFMKDMLFDPTEKLVDTVVKNSDATTKKLVTHERRIDKNTRRIQNSDSKVSISAR